MAVIQRAGSSYLVGDGYWFDGAVATNPVDTTVLVDSGVLKAGNYLVQVVAGSSVAWVYDLQHRDAPNTGNVHTQRRRPAAGPEDCVFTAKFKITLNERVRVVLVGNITGEVQVSLLIQEVDL